MWHEIKYLKDNTGKYMNYFLLEKQLAKFAFIYIYKDKRCNTSQIDIHLPIVNDIDILKAKINSPYWSSHHGLA